MLTSHVWLLATVLDMQIQNISITAKSSSAQHHYRKIPSFIKRVKFCLFSVVCFSTLFKYFKIYHWVEIEGLRLQGQISSWEFCLIYHLLIHFRALFLLVNMGDQWSHLALPILGTYYYYYYFKCNCLPVLLGIFSHR